jgi:hypothetical protein
VRLETVWDEYVSTARLHCRHQADDNGTPRCLCAGDFWMPCDRQHAGEAKAELADVFEMIVEYAEEGRPLPPDVQSLVAHAG